jgi:hypothetical protein
MPRKVEIVREMLAAGKATAAIAELAQCSESYVRAVKSRDSAPDKSTRLRRYSAYSTRSDAHKEAKRAGWRARQSAIADGYGKEAANRAARRAYKLALEAAHA